VTDKTYTRIVGSLSLASAFLLLVSALGTRLNFWPYTTGILLSLAAFVLAMGVLLLALGLLVRAWRRSLLNRAGPLVFYTLPALLVTLLISRMIAVSSSLPPIHNVSTDWVNPPQFSQMLTSIRSAEGSNDLSYTPEIAQLQRQAYSDLSPILSGGTFRQSFDKALRTVNSLGWTLQTANPRTGLIEATDTSFWFGFRDDIAIRIQDDSVGSRIDLRSVSRVGRADFGKNASRIRSFIRAWQTAED